jgi:transcription elongation factor Elf1
MWLDDGFGGEAASAQYSMNHSASLGLSLSSSDFDVSPSFPYIHVTPPSAALLDSNIDSHPSPALSIYGNSPALAQPLKNFPVTYDAASSTWRADAQLDLLGLECMSNDALEWTKVEEPQMTASHWAEMALTSAPHGHLDVSASGLPRSLSPLDQLFSMYPDSGSTSPYSSAPQSPSSHATWTSSRSSSICSTSPPPLTRRPIADCPSSPLPSSSPSTATKACTHCKATTTPLWRRDPATQNLLCNACGLYLQHRHVLRPQALIDADAAEDEDEALPAAEWTGPECSHCHTRNTSVWRRSKEGAQVCNACGVYQRLRGKPRPLRLKRNRIKPRTRRSLGH